MSAYIVDKNHILYLLFAAQSRCIVRGSVLRWFHKQDWHQIPTGDPDGVAEVGNMLWRENMASVGYRYPGESSATLPGPINGHSVIESKDLRAHWHTVNPVQVIKACDCFNYQSCEHPDWEGSEAKAFVDALRSHAWHSLPGYEEAAWGAPKAERGAA